MSHSSSWLILSAICYLKSTDLSITLHFVWLTVFYGSLFPSNAFNSCCGFERLPVQRNSWKHYHQSDCPFLDLPATIICNFYLLNVFWSDCNHLFSTICFSWCYFLFVCLFVLAGWFCQLYVLDFLTHVESRSIPNHLTSPSFIGNNSYKFTLCWWCWKAIR